MAVKKKQTAFMKPVKVSIDLANVIGPGPMPRTEVIKKLWEYIKKNKCQDSKNKRVINPDAKLGKVIGTKPIDMFEMNRKLANHLQPT